ncbi:alpha/beta hydrolase [Streptomyces sp. NPDC002520]
MTTVDPRVRELIDQAPFGIPAAELSPGALRAQTRTAIRGLEGARFTPDVVDRVEDHVIRGRGGEIPLRVYSAGGAAPAAVIVYFHGGGFAAGDLDTHDKITRRLSVATGAAVVSVDYRLAPERPFPAGFQDAYDSLLWASARYPGVPLVVAGDSAGGTLAACVALRARDEGGTALAGQVLLYPVIDDDAGTATMRAYATGFMLTRADMVTYVDWYLSRPEDRADPYALPGFATSLEGLPPAVITIGGFDPLRSAVEKYAGRLRRSGVPVELQSHPTLTHGWADYYPVVPAARRAVDELAGAVRALLEPATPDSPLTSDTA